MGGLGWALTRNKYPSYDPLKTIAHTSDEQFASPMPPATASSVLSIVHADTGTITNPSDPVQLVALDAGRGDLVKAFKEYDSFERIWSGRRVTYGVVSRCFPMPPPLPLVSSPGRTLLQHDFRQFVVLFCAEKVAARVATGYQ